MSFYITQPFYEWIIYLHLNREKEMCTGNRIPCMVNEISQIATVDLGYTKVQCPFTPADRPSQNRGKIRRLRLH